MASVDAIEDEWWLCADEEAIAATGAAETRKKKADADVVGVKKKGGVREGARCLRLPRQTVASRAVWPCGCCFKPVKNNDAGVFCEVCHRWFHCQCVSINSAEYRELQVSDDGWCCLNFLHEALPFADSSSISLGKSLFNSPLRSDAAPSSVSQSVSCSDGCGVCNQSVLDSDRGVFCNSCELWFHANCVDLDSSAYAKLQEEDDIIDWFCPLCTAKQLCYDGSLSSIEHISPSRPKHPLHLTIYSTNCRSLLKQIDDLRHIGSSH